MDDVIVNKVSVIQRCLKRIRDEYEGWEGELETNFTKQDSIILNLQRACEAAIDLGMRVIRLRKLGNPQTSREVFQLLGQERLIPKELSQRLQAMVGFRNVAVHDYQTLSLAIVRNIIETRLPDFSSFADLMASLDAS